MELPGLFLVEPRAESFAASTSNFHVTVAGNSARAFQVQLLQPRYILSISTKFLQER